MTEDVILVDADDKAIGQAEKQQVHEKGVLHRAFSILIFNRKGEMLIHKRAEDKYHSSGLWTNACCSHPRPGEETIDAAHRRLKEEMGFDCRLQYQFNFIYKSNLPNGLIEHELDHVYTGEFNGIPVTNKNEVDDFQWIGVNKLAKQFEAQPNKFTVWFRIIFYKYLQEIST